MEERPVWQWSASDLAAAIADRRLTAREAVEAAVTRMRARNPRINAVVDDLGDAALARAEELDRRMAAGGPVGPLHGVPVTIKENIDQKGRPTPNGVVAYREVVAPADSPVVRNLERAGAVVIGRTNTPEFSFRVTTDNPLHGRTLNPWDERFSPGGSSGGASAAVMSGMGALAHGNDIGGSLRYPSIATGATTVKPGLGRVPAYNPSAEVERGLLAQIMSVQGLIAREVRDLRLAMPPLVAWDPHDPWMVPMPFEGPPVEAPIRIAFTRETYEFELHPAVERALLSARDALLDAGYRVEEVEPPLVRETAREAFGCLMGEVRVLLEPEVRRHGSATVNAIFDEYFRQFRPYEGDELLAGMARRARYVREWTLFLERHPLLLTPFLPVPRYRWDRDTEGAEGVREVFAGGYYGIAMNFLGLPAGIVAAAMDEGLPVGVQIVGRRFREDLILDALEAVEQRIGVMAERLFEREDRAGG